MNEYEIERILNRLGRIFVAMTMLMLSMLKVVYKLLFHSENPEIVIVGIIFVLVAMAIAWLMLPMFFIGLITGLIMATFFGAGLVITKESS